MNYPPLGAGPGIFSNPRSRGGSWRGVLALSQVQGPRGGCWTQGGGSGLVTGFFAGFSKGVSECSTRFSFMLPKPSFAQHMLSHAHHSLRVRLPRARQRLVAASVPSRQPAVEPTAPPGDALQRQAETRAVMTRTVSSGRSRRARAGRRRSGGAWAARLRQRQRQRRQHQRQRQEKRHRGRPSHRVMMVPLRGRHHR